MPYKIINGTLNVELVPKSAWGKNLRSELSSSEWDWIKKTVSKHANHVCEVCGGVGDRWPVECHEKWFYDKDTKTQILKGFIALCPTCHQAKHIGLAIKNGYEHNVIKHIMKVNEWNRQTTMNHIEEQFNIWKSRNKIQWSLDTSYVDKALALRDESLLDKRLQKDAYVTF